VATSTGVLDGVAVYTWSGTQWTPQGGQPALATPSGALRGVAAFDWDGTQWQPAGQAGPDVATPQGVLQGVARFNWTGSAWAAVGAPSLSLDFMTPGTLDPRITFSRASTATYTDVNGTIQTAAVNAPRWDYDPVTHALKGLLIEEARQNQLSPSSGIGGTWAAYSTVGSITATANATVAPDGTTTGTQLVFPAVSGGGGVAEWYQGTGQKAGCVFSVWLKGAVGGEQTYISMNDGVQPSSGSPRLTLTTQWQRFSFVQPATTPNAGWVAAIGTVLSDVTNAPTPAQTFYIWGAQLEQGAFATSLIATTAAPVTRAADLASMPFTPAASGTYLAEFVPAGAAAGLPVIISGNAGSPVMSIGADSRLTASVKGGALVFSGVVPVITFNAVNKTAFGWLTGGSKAAVNSTALGANAVALAVTGTSIEIGSDGVAPGNNALNGYIRRVQYWPRQLSDAELRQVTT
jgi:hypothetical protein